MAGQTRKKKKKPKRGFETEKTITVGSKAEGFRNVPTLDFPGRRTTGVKESVRVAKKRGTASKVFKTIKQAVTAAKKRSASTPVSKVIQRAEEERTGKVIRSSKKKKRRKK